MGSPVAFAFRRLIWRAGRRLYMAARQEGPNDIAGNGESRLQRLVAARVRPGSRLVVFDVGARVGDWARTMVQSASTRSGGYEIHAFEPVPESRNEIERSFREQIAQEQVSINPIALSNEEKSVSLYVPHIAAGTSTIHPDAAQSYEQVLSIRTSTVDAYCRANSIRHVDLLKIDTEGHDFNVIQGAIQLVREARVGVVQFEYNHRWIYSRHYLKDVYDLVQGTPYRIAKICPHTLEVYVDWHPELERFFETNFAMVNSELLTTLDCRILRIGSGNACERVDRETLVADELAAGSMAQRR